MNPNQSNKIRIWLLARGFASMAAIVCLSVSAIAVPATPASAATCKNSGGGNKQITVGSQVNGDLVTICASKAFQKQLKKTIKIPAKPVVKPVTKPVLKKPVVKKPVTIPNTVYKIRPVVRPKPKAKPPVGKPKLKVVKKKVTGNKANSAVFRPTKPLVTVSPGTQLNPGQSATFSSKLAVRYGTAVLFGNLVQVRFTPKQWLWEFGDGTTSSSVGSTGTPNASPNLTAATSHSYSNAGTYSAFVRVEYAVAYRVKGGSWLADPDTIWLLSNVLNLSVGSGGGSATSGGTQLVVH
jgi:hypothetical protein